MNKANKYLLPVLAAAAVMSVILSIIMFSYRNRVNITNNNREYLLDNTNQMAMLVDDSLARGLSEIQTLSNLISDVVTVSKADAASLRRILGDSVFDFIELTDKDGWNYNTAGGISDASDRQYYLDAMAGNSGVELIFDSRATKETLLVFYAPVYENGKAAASLIGAYQATSQLDKLLTMEVFGHCAEAYLCNEDGLVVASNQAVDTTAEISIETVLGPRISGSADSDSFVYENQTAVIPLEGNETGACMMGLKNSSWYIVQVFPEEAGELMVKNANRIGIVLAVFLVSVWAVLLILTYYILNRAKIETQKALVQAEAASRAKTDFLFNMSHDIRTPMNAITGFLRLLDKQQEDSEKRKEYIQKMNDASGILLSIINNVLEMTKIESGKITLDETACSMEHLDHSMYTLFAAQMEEKHIRFERTADIRHPFVWCDMTKVREIYMNILSNAYKYTEDGGKVWMHLTEIPTDQEGQVSFKMEIQDTGIGISEEFIPYIFQEFSREHDSTHSGAAGTGLGMPIVKKLVEQMGGSISVESEKGKGTKITVILSFRTASETDLCGTDVQTAADFSGKRILIAEDNELNAEIAAEILSGMGFEVEHAEDGDVCVAMVERAQEGYYDLILMDIQMPNMNGYEAAEAVRKIDNPAKADIPIAALTANTFEEDKKNAYAAGMNAHLAKPIDVQKLKEALTELL